MAIQEYVVALRSPGANKAAITITKQGYARFNPAMSKRLNMAKCRRFRLFIDRSTHTLFVKVCPDGPHEASVQHSKKSAGMNYGCPIIRQALRDAGYHLPERAVRLDFRRPDATQKEYDAVFSLKALTEPRLEVLAS